MDEKPTSVFVSYARKDGNELAARLAESLERHGVAVWRDTRDIDPSKDFTAEIENAISQATSVVVCITPSTKSADSFVRREIAYAQILGKPLIVARFADTIPPISIVNNTWVDFVERDWETALPDLLQHLSQSPETLGKTAPQTDPCREHVERLYRNTVNFLDASVSRLIDLSAEVTEDAVESLNKSRKTAAQIFKSETENERTFTTFHNAFSHYTGRVLLLGAPGSGKTTTLIAFARDAAARRLENPEEPLPILGLIASWDPAQQLSFEQWILEENEIKTDIFSLCSRKTKVLYLLDGLDELGSRYEDQTSKQYFDPRARFIEMLPPEEQVVVTCRTRDYYDIGRKIPLNGAVTLNSLNDQQILEYLAEMPNLLNAVESDPELKSVVRNPFLLSICAYTFQDSAILSERLRDLRQQLSSVLFERFVIQRYQREMERAKSKGATPLPFTVDQVLTGLKDLSAYSYMQPWQMYATEAARTLNRYERERIGINEDLIEFMLQMQMLVAKDSEERLVFSTSLVPETMAFDPLSNYLVSKHKEHRFGAARGLGLLGKKEAIPLLNKAFRIEQDPYVANAIRQALDELHAECTIFLSYRRDDWAIAQLVAEHLETILLARVFIDRRMDKTDWEKRIIDAIGGSAAFVLICSSNTFNLERVHKKNDWIRKEINEAKINNIPIILAFADGHKPPLEELLPEDLKDIHKYQGFVVDRDGFEENIRQISNLISRETPIQFRPAET